MEKYPDIYGIGKKPNRPAKKKIELKNRDLFPTRFFPNGDPLPPEVQREFDQMNGEES